MKDTQLLRVRTAKNSHLCEIEKNCATFVARIDIDTLCTNVVGPFNSAKDACLKLLNMLSNEQILAVSYEVNPAFISGAEIEFLTKSLQIICSVKLESFKT